MIGLRKPDYKVEEIRKRKVIRSNTKEVQEFMNIDFQKNLQDSRIPQFPPAAVQIISTKYKMVKINVESVSEEELIKNGVN